MGVITSPLAKALLGLLSILAVSQLHFNYLLANADRSRYVGGNDDNDDENNNNMYQVQNPQRQRPNYNIKYRNQQDAMNPQTQHFAGSKQQRGDRDRSRDREQHQLQRSEASNIYAAPGGGSAGPNNRLSESSPAISEVNGETNKCRIWIPVEALSKYPGARDLQTVDQTKNLQNIEICCPGYGPVRWRGTTYCRPLCENCQNGFCIGREQCECFEGFTPNDNGDCVFTCPLGCLNGRCYLDGSCQCEPGYKLDEARKYCRPICSGGCDLSLGQNCTEPEVCGCAKGYQLRASGCERVCEPDCGIGGQCNKANECECNQGFALREGICQSDCYQSCANGICVSRNRCICNPGYTYHERSTMCIPV